MAVQHLEQQQRSKNGEDIDSPLTKFHPAISEDDDFDEDELLLYDDEGDEAW